MEEEGLKKFENLSISGVDKVFKQSKMDEILFGKIIGSGSYAKVFQYCCDEKLFAIKCIEFKNYIDLRRVLREIQILKYLRNCPFIVKYHKGFLKNDSVYLILDRYDNDLKTLLKMSNEKPLTEPYVKYISYQIISGLKCLHQVGILHRDIKPANILINYSSCKTVICDFNLSRVMGQMDVEAPMTQDVVTRWYKAPELLNDKLMVNYGEGVDMWALGCTIVELLIGTALWKGDDNEMQYSMILNTVNNNLFPSILRGDVLDFLKRIFQINPLLRMTAADALDHPWIKNSLHLYQNEFIHFDALEELKSCNFGGHVEFLEDKKQDFLYLCDLLEKELKN
jgi:mitogen-activated protein kinase 15